MGKSSAGFKSDLHIHTQFSDGRLSVAEIVDLYGRQGFGAIAITDHLSETKGLIGQVTKRLKCSLSEDTFYWYMATIKREAQRAWDEYGMLVLPGYEITKNSFVNSRSGHVLIIGCEEFIDPNLDMEQILAVAKKHGALTIAAHPFHTGEWEFQSFYLWDRREEFKEYIDAWEVNCRGRIEQTIAQSGLPLIASSDFHHPKHFYSWKSSIQSERTPQALFQAVREQKVSFFFDQG